MKHPIFSHIFFKFSFKKIDFLENPIFWKISKKIKNNYFFAFCHPNTT